MWAGAAVRTLPGMNALVILRIAHIAAGAVALLAMPVPLIARKGSPLHRRFGAVFAWAMAASLLLSVAPLVERATRNLPFALFLTQILLLSSASVGFGVRALAAKKAPPPFRLERVLAAVFLAASLAFLGHAAWTRAGVSFFFGALSAVMAASWLRFFLNPQREAKAWFHMHITGMCTAAIAALTAFVVVNAAHLGVPVELRWIGWTAPAVLGGIGIGFWQRYYRARFAAG